MGRIVDLCGEIAAEADEGPDGRLQIAPDVWERLREEWRDEDIEDALALVHDSLLQGELVESADSLSTRLVDILGSFADEKTFAAAAEGEARLTLEMIGQLTRRVDRLEEILEAFRDPGTSPDRRAFDRLQRRLADYGIEKEMAEDRATEAGQAGGRPLRGQGPDADEAEDQS